MLLTISFSFANAQLNAVWTRVYGGPQGLSESATSCITDDEGNIYVAGNSHSSSTRNDFVLIKYTSSGVVEWEN
ncbi:MAG: SBBP repeat-containing protein [Ignavibacteria bacterium]|nr:SBBP repeat-containing protein [Ignavibacteria bacterium]